MLLKFGTKLSAGERANVLYFETLLNKVVPKVNVHGIKTGSVNTL